MGNKYSVNIFEGTQNVDEETKDQIVLDRLVCYCNGVFGNKTHFKIVVQLENTEYFYENEGDELNMLKQIVIRQFRNAGFIENIQILDGFLNKQIGRPVITKFELVIHANL